MPWSRLTNQDQEKRCRRYLAHATNSRPLCKIFFSLRYDILRTELIENLTKLLSRRSKELTKNNWQAVLIEGEENNKLFFSGEMLP